MNLTQHLLVKLSEECNEVAKECLKIVVFGPGDHNPKDQLKTSNINRLFAELDDLHACIELLNNTGLEYTPDTRRILDKKVKVVKYLEYSIDRGMTDKKALSEMDACFHPNGF